MLEVVVLITPQVVAEALVITWVLVQVRQQPPIQVLVVVLQL
jgi:hypothetical protein